MKMKTTSPQLTAYEEVKPGFGWIDALVLAVLFGLLWSALHFGQGMLVHFDPSDQLEVDSSPAMIPYYAGRTLLRMWIAFAFSLFFAIGTGYLAAKSRRARALILPALDILQSVPVLGFLSATVAGFMALFPGSLMGVECAAIFAIFTGQVWNMAFGFYHSMVTIPTDMQEAATTYRLTAWQRFRTVELPASAVAAWAERFLPLHGSSTHRAPSRPDQCRRDPGEASRQFRCGDIGKAVRRADIADGR